MVSSARRQLRRTARLEHGPPSTSVPQGMPEAAPRAGSCTTSSWATMSTPSRRAPMAPGSGRTCVEPPTVRRWTPGDKNRSTQGNWSSRHRGPWETAPPTSATPTSSARPLDRSLTGSAIGKLPNERSPFLRCGGAIDPGISNHDARARGDGAYRSTAVADRSQNQRPDARELPVEPQFLKRVTPALFPAAARPPSSFNARAAFRNGHVPVHRHRRLHTTAPRAGRRGLRPRAH